MIGILVQLLLSAVLLWFLEGKRLSVLGFRPDGYRMRLFAGFFLLSAAICTGDYLLKMAIAQQRWVLANPVQPSALAAGLWWNVKSVLFEELLFRGALLYILLRRLGLRRAILLSAAAFGVYHWFSYQVFGHPLPMLLTFVLTGSMGAVYAFAYARTQTLYAPIAMHLGWNGVRSIVFSDTTLGKQLFVAVQPAPVVQVSYLQYFILLYAAMAAAVAVNGLILRRMPQRALG